MAAKTILLVGEGKTDIGVSGPGVLPEDEREGADIAARCPEGFSRFAKALRESFGPWTEPGGRPTGSG